MPSRARGNNISAVEVQGVSRHGLWLAVHGKEYLLSFEKYPWFKNATIDAIYQVSLHHGHHLHWPTLDIDLELDSLEHPEQYPLCYQTFA